MLKGVFGLFVFGGGGVLGIFGHTTQLVGS